MRTIGKGMFASVELARRGEDKTLVAIKRASKRGKNGKFAQFERDALLRCQGHPFIPVLFGAYQTDDTLCIVLEFLIGGIFCVPVMSNSPLHGTPHCLLREQSFGVQFTISIKITSRSEANLRA
jgi:serine/threonine protein kinase